MYFVEVHEYPLFSEEYHMHKIMIQKRCFVLFLLVQVFTCLGVSESEKFFVEKLMPAVDEVDRLFSGKKGTDVFAVNAPVFFKKTIASAIKKLLENFSKASGDVLQEKLDLLKNDGVLANWQDASGAGWVDADPKDLTAAQKKAINNIMTIYSGSTKRPLGNKVANLVTNEYLVLRNLAEEIDKLFADSKFGVNADTETKEKIQVAITAFVKAVRNYRGIASKQLTDLLDNEVFACWKKVAEDTGWLNIERDAWKEWKKDNRRSIDYDVVSKCIPRIMELYAKNDKKFVTKFLNQIFGIVRDILVNKARLVEIADERENLKSKEGLMTEDLAGIEDKIMPRAEILDKALSVISMNASEAQKEYAKDAVEKFVEAVKAYDPTILELQVVKDLVNHPIIKSWQDTKAIDSWYNFSDFSEWKKNNPQDYKAFGKAADGFMKAYSKSKTAMQNAIRELMKKAGGTEQDLKKLDKEEDSVANQEMRLLEKLAAWKPQGYRLPEFSEESGRGGALGVEEDEEKPVKNLAYALKELSTKK